MNRILFSDNGTLSDMSVDLENFNYGVTAITYTKDEDYIYLGSMHPFNGFYFHPSVANATPVAITVEHWDGTEFIDAVDVIDETNSLGEPGYINFTPSQRKSWSREDTVDSSGNKRIDELSTVFIYNQYWARISFSETISFSLKYVGHKFSNDTDLFIEYPEFNNLKLLNAIESGKTDWNLQNIRASRLLIEDLISRNVISYGTQILDRRKFMTSNLHGAASLIFKSLGRDYSDELSGAVKDYESRISKGNYSVDQNSNATLDIAETKSRMGRLFK